MSNKTYLCLVSAIFSIITIVHGLRAIYGWDAVIGGYSLPMWVSYLGVLLAGFLAYSGYRAYKMS
jgi:hypothetical protein